MEFGPWIRSLREVQHLDLRTLEDRSQVGASHISRVERSKSSTTILTAIRLCRALGVTSSDLFLAVREKSLLLQEPASGEAVTVLTLTDIEQFLTSYHENQAEVQAWLSDLLNQVFLLSHDHSESIAGSASSFFVPVDIQKLLYDSPLYRFELRYPPATTNDIISILRQGGILTLADSGEFITRLRWERQLTWVRYQQMVGLHPRTLSRFESGSAEQIKLADVLTVDEQLGQEGILFAIYWSAYSFSEQLVDRDLQLVTLFTTICRWLQWFHHETLWINHLRSIEKRIVAHTGTAIGYGG